MVESSGCPLTRRGRRTKTPCIDQPTSEEGMVTTKYSSVYELKTLLNNFS
jgi:hypothetical protein